MALHSFDPRVAEKVGINAAVLFQNIAFWVQKNVANERNFYDGRYWTYSSREAFRTLFPYMGDKAIYNALKKLETGGLIVTGTYNKSAYDRTKWYSITESGYQLIDIGDYPYPKNRNGKGQDGNIDCAKSTINRAKGTIENGERHNQNLPKAQPIPYINTDITTDITTDNILLCESSPDGEDDDYEISFYKDESKSKIPYQEVIDSFNEICGDSLPKVTKASSKRKKSIKSLLKEYSFDEVIDVFRKTQASDYLTGRNGIWYNCSFDWIMNPNNFLKVFEGTYDNAKGGSNGPGGDFSGVSSQTKPRLFEDEYI